MVDVGEVEIERPKKTKTLLQWRFKVSYIKAQLLLEFETGQIITAVGKSKTHDFKLFKRSRIPFRASQLPTEAIKNARKQHKGACTSADQETSNCCQRQKSTTIGH